MECEFCEIIRGRSRAEVIFENERIISILDINPIHFGHALVIPKRHCETFVDVPDEDLSELIRIAKCVSRSIMDILKPEGFNIFSNNGKAAGQSVFHFHLHVTPRYLDDNIRFVLKLKKYEEGQITTYGGQLRQQIFNQLHHVPS